MKVLFPRGGFIPRYIRWLAQLGLVVCMFDVRDSRSYWVWRWEAEEYTQRWLNRVWAISGAMYIDVPAKLNK